MFLYKNLKRKAVFLQVYLVTPLGLALYCSSKNVFVLFHEYPVTRIKEMDLIKITYARKALF